jgi:hypothetical protein
LAFAPAIVVRRVQTRQWCAQSSRVIEIVISAATVRVPAGTDAATLPGARPDGSDMIAVPAGLRVPMATTPVDFRRGAGSLAALVREQLKHDPFLGTIFIFRRSGRTG